MKLIIVESPTKARTITNFLSKDYEIESSYGHVRDLPRGDLGVDVEKNFEPRYVIPTKARKQVGVLKKLAQKADLIILATDEDREGEAIAWHIAQILDLGECKVKSAKCKTVPYKRIVFHEITKNAILRALEKPREIDMHRVDAQQARRILDRLVGYKLSPFLWKKVARGLSAGRVQSVAVRLVAEREAEINAFKPEEYWTIVASLLKCKVQSAKCKNKDKDKESEIFCATLIKANNKVIPKLGIKCKAEVDKILGDLKNAEYQVIDIEQKQKKRNPLPPFTTSTLQQEAGNRLGFSAKQTMMIAQQLYEGLKTGKKAEAGLITYMRTDSFNLAESALRKAGTLISEKYGKNYVCIRRYKTRKKSAQEAHEAIRPTNPFKTPESIQKYLDAKQFKLYDLIWRRMIASQMSAAVLDAMRVDIKASNYVFRATGQRIEFDGFLKIYPLKFKENILPALSLDQILELQKLISEQHFTKPPARYSEAGLIKILEKFGIGRPSTYAPTLHTIQARGYVEKIDRRFKPKEMGLIVNKLLVKHFPKIVDIDFTAKMEQDLDEIALGKKEWQPIISEFWKPFSENLKEKYEEVEKKDVVPDQKTDQKCEKCGKPMIIKMGRFGKFLACSGFPECKNAKPIVKSTGIKCPKCKKGELAEKHTKKRGRVFWGCNRYPKCDFAVWDLKKLEQGEKKEEDKSKEK